MNRRPLWLLAIIISPLLTTHTCAQFNQDEAKVPMVTLPDPLLTTDGQNVA